jgi:hypothetical protein
VRLSSPTVLTLLSAFSAPQTTGNKNGCDMGRGTPRFKADESYRNGQTGVLSHVCLVDKGLLDIPVVFLSAS